MCSIFPGLDDKIQQMKQEKSKKKKELGDWFKKLADRVRSAVKHDEI